MRKNHIIAVCVLIVVVSTVMIFANGGRSKECVLALPLDTINQRIDLLDLNAAQFASTAVDVIGRSTEGGTQATFTKSGVKQIVEQRFYGETGRTYMRFYYNRGKLFALVKLDLSYAVPIFVDSNVTVKTSEKKDFYFGRNETVCRWFLNDVEQTVDEETRDMIREYIAGIL